MKTFEVGEVVLFLRDTEHGRKWELGEYLAPVHDMAGWHRVRDDTGFHERHIVPARRIKHTDDRMKGT